MGMQHNCIGYRFISSNKTENGRGGKRQSQISKAACTLLMEVQAAFYFSDDLWTVFKHSILPPFLRQKIHKRPDFRADGVSCVIDGVERGWHGKSAVGEEFRQPSCRQIRVHREIKQPAPFVNSSSGCSSVSFYMWSSFSDDLSLSNHCNGVHPTCCVKKLVRPWPPILTQLWRRKGMCML